MATLAIEAHPSRAGLWTGRALSTLVTLFLTRYLMPVLYSFFPGDRVGRGAANGHALSEGSHYADEILGETEKSDKPSAG